MLERLLESASSKAESTFLSLASEIEFRSSLAERG
jgi:hypothetical protein